MIRLNSAYLIPFEIVSAGVRVAADSLPTAVLYRNGSASGVTVVVATTGTTGRYHASFTTDSGWAVTDFLYLDVSSTIAAVSRAGIVWDSGAEPAANSDSSGVATLLTRVTDVVEIKTEADTRQTALITAIGSVPAAVWSAGTRTITGSTEGSPIGPGSIEKVVTITETGFPVDGAAVWVSMDSGGSNVVAGTLYSDAFGVVKFMLDAGTYYVWVQKAGVNFDNPTTLVVAA